MRNCLIGFVRLANSLRTDLVAIIYLLFLSPFGTAQEICKNEGQVIRTSNNKIAPGEIADPVGFCSHHASRDLLHQTLCKTKPDNCFQPATLDFLAEDGKLPPNSGDANTNSALEKILDQGRVTEEICLKFNDLFNASSKEFKTYGEKFHQATHTVILKECLGADCDGLTIARDSIASGKELACQKIANSSERTQYLYSAVARFKKDKNCESKKITSFTLKRQNYNPKSPSATAQMLNSILENGNFVKLGTISPHALVVANFRVICLNGRETLQYQTLDSLYGTKWAEARSPGDWVSGQTLIDQLHPEGGFSWLEPKVNLGFSYQVPNASQPTGLAFVAVTGVEPGSAAYLAGLRNGMNYQTHEVDPKGTKVTVWFNEPGKPTKKISYSISP